jgi:hypothetical protein
MHDYELVDPKAATPTLRLTTEQHIGIHLQFAAAVEANRDRIVKNWANGQDRTKKCERAMLHFIEGAARARLCLCCCVCFVLLCFRRGGVGQRSLRWCVRVGFCFGGSKLKPSIRLSVCLPTKTTKRVRHLKLVAAGRV